jgi:tetratricopeptide (TPR) repeat protein
MMTVRRGWLSGAEAPARRLRRPVLKHVRDALQGESARPRRRARPSGREQAWRPLFITTLIVLRAAPLAAQGRDAGAAARVRALADRGQHAEAIAAARRADLVPALAALLRETGQRDAADTVLRRALAQRRPDSLLVRLEYALLRHGRGEHAEARRLFDGFIDAYNGAARLRADELAAVGLAVQHLSAADPQLARDALRAYDEALAADPDHLEARLRVGWLFLERYNGTEARAAFEAILERDSTEPRTLLGLARTAQFEGSRAALDLVRRSLERNPRLVEARVFYGELLAELEEYEAARREATQALSVNPQSLAALSLQAAIAWLTADTAGLDASRRAVRSLNPRYAPLETTLAEAAARQRRYAEAAEFARRAVRLDSTYWRGLALLGINELRMGAMDSARVHLERAFAGDPFDVWTKNTLDLLDVLDKYATRTSPRFRVVADRAEVDVLAPYVVALADEAYEAMAARYGVRPRTPVRIELFHRHADFSVRTVGLVGLGALGVSFGPVVAMDSPAARERGEFNWGSTLWHELAHTFHLALSRHRVPRWLTEGLAVYEERLARPGWGDDLTPAFAAAWRSGRLVHVGLLNNGFVRPAYPEQIIFSYYQASLVCELIATERGFDALVRMLQAYGNGLGTADVFRTVLGESLEQFNTSFTAWLEQRFAGQLAAVAAHGESSDRPATRVSVAERARRNPGDFGAQLAMGQQLVRDRRAADAVAYLERARTLFPEYAEEDGPYRLLAAIARERGDLRRAEAELAAMTAVNERAYAAFVDLADVRIALRDSAGAVEALDRAAYVDPTEIALHQRLADLADRLGRRPLLVRERRAIVALDPPDPADAYYRLARAELAAGDREAARRSVLRALELAPAFDAALELLLEIRGGGR